MSNEDLQIKFGADTTSLDAAAKHAAEGIKEVARTAEEVGHSHDGFDRLRESINQVKESLNAMRESFVHALEFAGLEIGFNAFKEFVKETAELGEQTERMAKKLGISTIQVGELNAIAKLTGTDIGSLEHGFERLQVSLARAVESLNPEQVVGFLQVLISKIGDVAIAINSFVLGAEKQIGHLTLTIQHFTDPSFKPLRDDLKLLDDDIAARSASMKASVAGVVAEFNRLTGAAAGAASAPGKLLMPLRPAAKKATEEEHPKPQVPELHLGGGGGAAADDAKDGLAAAQKALEGQIAIAVLQQAKLKAILDGQVAQHKITQEQEDAQLEAGLDRQYAMQVAALQKELLLPDIKLAKAQEIHNKLEQLEIKHQTTMIELQNKSIAEVTKKWQDLGDTIKGAWDSQLRGLLAGQTSWAQAMKNITADLVLKMIEAAESWVVKNAAIEAASLILHQTAEGGKVAASVASAAAQISAADSVSIAGAAAMLASFGKSIAAAIGSTIASVSAFLAPFIGPAAPAAGIGAGAAVAAAIPSFDIGAWHIPRDTLAQLHGREMVIPAGPATDFRSIVDRLGAAAGGSGGREASAPAAAVVPAGGNSFSVGEVHVHNSAREPLDGAKLADALVKEFGRGHSGLRDLMSRR